MIYMYNDLVGRISGQRFAIPVIDRTPPFKKNVSTWNLRMMLKYITPFEIEHMIRKTLLQWKVQRTNYNIN